MLPEHQESKNHSNIIQFEIHFKQYKEFKRNVNFNHIQDENDFQKEYQLKIQKLDFIMIEYYEHNLENLFLTYFDDQLVIIKDSNQSIIKKLFDFDLSKCNFYFLSNSINNFTKIIQMESSQMNEISIPQKMVNVFMNNLILSSNNKVVYLFFAIIKSYLSTYFIQKSYLKCNINRISDFLSNIEHFVCIQEREFQEKEFIFFDQIDSGTETNIYLSYHIKSEQLFALKTRKTLNETLFNRETQNNKLFCHPLVTRYYGTLRNKGTYSIVLEYLHGSTLENIEKLKLSFYRKISILFEIFFIFEYLHSKNLVYRDLKPNNVILDRNDHIVLIDFDRLIHEKNNFEEFTNDFSSVFYSPELIVPGLKPTVKSDMYSIGKMIYYILFEELSPNDETSQSFLNNEMKYPKMISLYKQCTHINPNDRIDIEELIKKFKQYILDENYQQQNFKGLNISENEFNDTRELIKSNILLLEQVNEVAFLFDKNISNEQFSLKAFSYIEKDKNKLIKYLTIAASLNHSNAQNFLGFIYYKGIFVDIDMDKSIYYLSLAADQNHLDALNSLGYIYYKCENITRDMNKSIHYLSIAAYQNYSEAQNILGIIYYEGVYISRDINKSIHYYKLAADQNHIHAQYQLGRIYYENKYISRDINKSIHYYSLAAEQKNPHSQYELGFIYYEESSVRDINKSIYYLKLAADQQLRVAQYKLGLIYYEAKYITRDMDQSIHYLTLAANQNYSNAQILLGIIFYEAKYVRRDIDKAIYFYMLAADQNHSEGLFFIGYLYYEGNYVQRDVNKSIYYLTLAANQNHANAQNALGVIYCEGKYVKRDINKSIIYLMLSAIQKFRYAQYSLGILYYENKYIARDMNKSIYYLTLAANQNVLDAQFELGLIYYKGEYITRDIDKSIYYFTLAADQNHSNSQNYLGCIYYDDEYIARDINKAIYYFTLSANQNNIKSQFSLGIIYYQGGCIIQDINKSIHFLTLAANRYDSSALYILGYIYYEGKYIAKNIYKSIHYWTLAANQNHPDLNYGLGMIYFYGIGIKQNVEKSLYFMNKASQLNDRLAQMHLGDFYLDAKYVKRDVNKSISFYKDASVLTKTYAKNNLGVIYKNGFDSVDKNVLLAKEYFSESIKESHNQFSMYNLANILLDEAEKDNSNDKIIRSIDLLIKASSKLENASILICLVLIKKFKTRNFASIQKAIQSYFKEISELDKIIRKYFNYVLAKISYPNSFENIYNKYRKADCLFVHQHIVTFDSIKHQKIFDVNSCKKKMIIKQSKIFYEGFGDDLSGII